MKLSPTFNHEAVVRDYGFKELVFNRRLAIAMIRFYMRARIEAKSEVLKQQITLELQWWDAHNNACRMEIDNRCREQN